MIEAVAAEPGPSLSPLPAEDGITAGALLQRAREAAGLHVAALAASLKVPVRKLEALESDRYDQLSDAVFVRGLASSICRHLKVDAQPVLDRLPQSAAPRLIHDNDGLNAPFHGPLDGNGLNWPGQLSKPVVVSVFALLLGALVLILLPRMQTSDDASAPDARLAEVTAPEGAAAVETERPAGPAVVASLSPTAPATGMMPASLPAPTAMPLPAGPATGSVSAEAAAPAVPASGILVFRTKGSSWVEVTDAKGVVAFRKLMAAGETGAASGALPLQVTVGRADVTEVLVRGKTFDLRPVARDNVARFEVK